MKQYSVDQVARLLGLHVKTVRAYIRDGRLRAVRIGKQYRIAGEDLAAFTGRPAPARRHAEVSAIVQVDGVGRDETQRISIMVTSALAHGPHGLRVEFVHDEERAHLKIIVLGALDAAAQVLRIIDALVRD
ncbi:MAG: helix-turn-helix domain-containing protein [Thermoactinospora sp.]|nr:helix-turn-helix domain-containing protein [Thermoactinospora sp.]